MIKQPGATTHAGSQLEIVLVQHWLQELKAHEPVP